MTMQITSKIKLCLLGLVLFLTTALSTFPSKALSKAPSETKQFQIIIASDMPLIDDPIHGDFRELQTLLIQTRNDEVPNFFVFAGGSLGPSPMSSFDKGAHIIDLLNWLEPDVMTLSKREFIYDEEELTLRSFEALFPFVSSNLVDTTTGKNLHGILGSVIIKKGGVTLAVTSVLDKEIEEEYLLKKVRILPIYDSIKKEAAYLRQQNVDLIVLTYIEPDPIITRLLEENIVDAAILVGRNADEVIKSNRNNTHLQIDKLGEVLQLDVTKLNDNLTLKPTYLKLQNFGRNRELSKHTLSYKNRIDRLLDIKISEFSTSISTERKLVRSGENGFGNLVADALRQAVNADIAFVNGGVIRGNRTYKAGTSITRRTISNELPFRSRLRLIEISGAQLKQVMENAFSQLPDLKGRFLHISGFKVDFDINRSVGNRVVAMSFQGKPITSEQKFLAATTDFLVQGGDGFDVLRNANNVSGLTGRMPLLSDVVISYIRKHESLNVQIEGRLNGQQ